LLIIETFITGPLDTNTYLVIDEVSRRAFVIDAGKDSCKEILEAVEEREFKIIYIINTHGHWDHTADDKILRDSTKAELVIHELDADLLAKGISLPHFNLTTQAIKPDFLLRDGDLLKLGDNGWKIIHTPGHTRGSICVYSKDKRTIFSGDLLFAGSYGRTDLEGGDELKMMDSLKRIASLPKNTQVFPGHGERTSIGKEKWLNDLF